jgi:hypothetical protein
MNNVIQQFMWKWQQYFRISVQTLANMSLEKIGARLDPQVVLVGIADDPSVIHPICVEPETGPFQPVHLTGIDARAVQFYEEDPERQIWHSDPGVHAARQAWLRGRARGTAIAELIEASGTLPGKRCFATGGTAVSGFVVHVVLAVDEEAFDSLPALEGEDVERFPAPSSLTRQVLRLVLDEAGAALRVPDPSSSALRQSSEDIVREAAERLCAGCLYRTRNFDLSSAFRSLNEITARAYEGSGAHGRLLLASPDNPGIEVVTRLDSAVNLNAGRAVRKLLQTSNRSFALLVHDGGVYGLGRLRDGEEPQAVYEIEVTAHATWELRRGSDTLMRVAYGAASLPSPMLDVQALEDTIERVFESRADTDYLVSLIAAATTARHGTTLVVSADASGEAERLAGSATLVMPDPLTPALLSRYAEMDGAVLVDPDGTCFAVGVILDGQAHERGDPARGARYNSSLRYEASATPPTVVVVVSEDGGADVIPTPRLRIHRQTVTDAVTRLEASLDPEHPGRFSEALDGIKDLAFYLSPDQCTTVNETSQAEQRQRMESGTISIVWPTFAPHPDMNDSYFLD